MSNLSINTTVLMSGADQFRVEELNPYSDRTRQPDITRAVQEHDTIRAALRQAGVRVIQVPAPAGCQDGVYTANWALCQTNQQTGSRKAILSSLPNLHRAEQPYAHKTLEELGYQVVEAPYLFSGQGDALPYSRYLLAGSGYRTDRRMHDFLAEQLDYEVISLQTIPELDSRSQPVINAVTGLPDSFFYDIDLALAVLRSHSTNPVESLIAWCPEAFTLHSQAVVRALPMQKIEVSLAEARQGFACNLLSTGETVVMSALAPQLRADIEAQGLMTVAPDISELIKGGGFIRCTTLTL